jgi:hypothetical protein
MPTIFDIYMTNDTLSSGKVNFVDNSKCFCVFLSSNKSETLPIESEVNITCMALSPDGYTMIVVNESMFISTAKLCVNQTQTFMGAVMVVTIWYLDIQLPVQSLPITTNVVNLNPANGRCTRYNIM